MYKVCNTVKMTKNLATKAYDIYSIITPMYYLSKFFGLAPMTFTVTHLKQKILRTSVFSSIYTIFLMSVIVIINVYTIINKDKLPDTDERARGVFILEMLTYGTTAVLGLGASLMKHRNVMNTLLFKVSIFDELLCSENTNTMKRNRVFVFVQTIVLITVYTCIFLEDFLLVIFDKDYSYVWKINMITVYVCTSIIAITITQYVDLVQLLKQKINTLNHNIILTMNLADGTTEDILFKTINIYDSNIFEASIIRVEKFEKRFKKWCNAYMNNNFTSAFRFSSSHIIIRFRASRVLYDVLCDICHMINSMYGFQILIFTTSNFILMNTSLSYGIISLLTYDESNEKYRYPACVSLLWGMMLFIMQMCPRASCSAASNESDKLTTSIQKLLLIPEVDPEIVAELQLFSQQVNARRIKFTAMGFFTVNCRNLGTIVGACITLLLILLQFQKVNNLF